MEMGKPVESGAPKSGGEPGLEEIVEMGGKPDSPFTSMVAGVNSALSKMEELLPQAGVAPELVQKLSGIREAYTALLQEINGGGQQAPQAAPRVDVNAGASGIPKA